MDAIIQWFVDNLKIIFQWMYNYLIDLCNAVIFGLAGFIEKCADLLPNYTLPSVTKFLETTEISGWLGWLNWFLPIDAILTCIGIVLFSTTTHFLLAPVLRWVKLVR